MDRLRAKSWDPADGIPPKSVVLPNHLADVALCADAIIEATGVSQLNAFGIDSAKVLSRFRKLTVLAAACHDLGKANSQFQSLVLVQRDSTQRQAVRHEWVSWYILQHTTVREWLYSHLDASTREIDWQILLWAITGHHPAYGRDIRTTSPSGSTDKMELYLGHDDFHAALGVVAKNLDLADCPLQLISRTISVEDHIYQKIRHSLADYKMQWDEWAHDSVLVGILAAIKNTLVAADVAGSAFPTSSLRDASQSEWKRIICESLTVSPTTDELSQLIDDRLTFQGQKHSLREFQLAVANDASEVTLVKAGCGSGKTLAAYHWARERCPGKRLYVCYPTTGTATEGFRDYLFDKSEHQPKSGAELFHGRSVIDNQIILETANEDSENQFEALDRIRSLKAWSVPVVSCTVDTVLGIIHNQRRAIYSWPAVCNAAYVFDEIHSYDASMFGALLAFLKKLRGVPVLLMTASLPAERLKKLKAAVRNRSNGLVEISGPPELESLKRYRRLDDPNQPVIGRAAEEVKSNGKVLWVSNTVARTMEAYRSCSEFATGDTVYHSRFRYIDRVRRHQAVISKFAEEGKSAIAWTSQVAEMSLDLSATLLVTDLAPIPALIQRLGRLNRRARLPSDPIMPFIVIEPLDKDGKLVHRPYEQEQLEEARVWLSKLPDEITQQDLVEVWEGLGTVTKEDIFSGSTWIDGGYDRTVKELRDASPGVTIIMRSDVVRVRSGECSLAEVVIPMNPRSGMDFDQMPKFQGIPIVDEKQLRYSELLGGEWI